MLSVTGSEHTSCRVGASCYVRHIDVSTFRQQRCGDVHVIMLHGKMLCGRIALMLHNWPASILIIYGANILQVIQGFSGLYIICEDTQGSTPYACVFTPHKTLRVVWHAKLLSM